MDRREKDLNGIRNMGVEGQYIASGPEGSAWHSVGKGELQTSDQWTVKCVEIFHYLVPHHLHNTTYVCSI